MKVTEFDNYLIDDYLEEDTKLLFHMWASADGIR